MKGRKNVKSVSKALSKESRVSMSSEGKALICQRMQNNGEEKIEYQVIVMGT